MTALLIDEDSREMSTISALLERLNIRVMESTTGKEAIEILSSTPADIVISDILLPDTDGMNILRFVRKNQEQADVVILTESDSKEAAERILRHGAADYIDRPIVERDFLHKINRLLKNRAIKEQCGIVGHSEPIREILETVQLIAPTNVSVLVTGESGTGKELIAKAIHLNSLRSKEPFIAVNCGALPEGVLESELFGHEKGAFTSADRQRAGRFEIAGKGSLFLDEIGEMPLTAQVKLLRVLETGEFMRVGGTRMQQSKARIIAATNKTLEEEVAGGRFRKDLYYRLKAVMIDVPPLRARRADIPLLVTHFAPRIYREHNLPEHEVPQRVIAALREYDWPGNIRELRNVLESMIILSPNRTLNVHNLPDQIKGGGGNGKNLPVRVEKSRDAVEREIIYKTILGIRADIAELKDLVIQSLADRREVRVESMEDWVEAVRGNDNPLADIHESDKEISNSGGGSMTEMERILIVETLVKHHGNRKKTARELGIGERTLYRKLKEYNIT